MNLKQNITHNLLNIPGWRTKRHIVVIESDDWGAIRMPSKEVYNKLLSEGIRVDRDPYCRYDGLATANDLEALFEALTSVKDSNNNYPIITANCVVANPNFEEIKKSNYSEYFYETIAETYNKSEKHQGVWRMWKEGVNNNIFYPQFHGREHLNIKEWLQALRSNDIITHKGFEYGLYGLTHNVDSSIKCNYMGAFDSAIDEDVMKYKEIITDGLNIFEKLFGYRSKSFIATRYTWPEEIELTLKNNDILYLQGIITHVVPVCNDRGFIYRKDNYQGKKNKNGLIHLMRNCFFEPTLSNNSENIVNDCLNRINIAFRWNKAAVISSHRINFVGLIDERNRINNIRLFKILLSEIVKRWPDVEFVSSAQLGDIISSSYIK